jgi:hypothetical protein
MARGEVKTVGMERRIVQSTGTETDLGSRAVENGKTARRWIGGAFGWLRKSVSVSSPKWAVLAGLLHCSASQGQGFRVRSGGVQGWGRGQWQLDPGASSKSPVIAASGNPLWKRNPRGPESSGQSGASSHVPAIQLGTFLTQYLSALSVLDFCGLSMTSSGTSVIYRTQPANVRVRFETWRNLETLLEAGEAESTE